MGATTAAAYSKEPKYDGVYLARHVQKWLCGARKGAVATKQKQPAGLTRQIVWGDRAKTFPMRAIFLHGPKCGTES